MIRKTSAITSIVIKNEQENGDVKVNFFLVMQYDETEYSSALLTLSEIFRYITLCSIIRSYQLKIKLASTR